MPAIIITQLISRLNSIHSSTIHLMIDEDKAQVETDNFSKFV